MVLRTRLRHLEKIIEKGRPVKDGYGTLKDREYPPGYKTIHICLNCDLPTCSGSSRCKRLLEHSNETTTPSS